MQSAQEFITYLLFPTSLGGIILRGIIWGVIALVIVVSSNRYASNLDTTSVIKRRLGSLIIFMGLSMGLVFLLFSYVPV
jgi:hypothetical protein